MNLLPVAEFLEEQGLAEQGKTLFLNHFPADVTDGVMLRPRLIGSKLDHDLPGYVKFQFQIIVRSSNYARAEELATLIAKTLTIKQSRDMGSWRVNYILPEHIPVGYPISVGELVEFNTDYFACIVDEAWA